MNKLLLTKKQLRLFLIVCTIITAPLGLLTVVGAIENESGLIMILPLLAGLPWVLIYFCFDIPGLTSPGLPETSGTLSIFELILFMLPVYINIYLVVRLLFKDPKSLKESAMSNKFNENWRNWY
ncbi:MAG: hypothetical protein GY941_15275 [Planctomycetes bacterium]|nr:hypothetical protein [Planctomycetota bacterium]